MVASCWTFIDTDLQHSRTPGPPSGLPIPGNFYRLPLPLVGTGNFTAICVYRYEAQQ